MIDSIKYKKLCPSCGREIIYSGINAKYHLTRSIRENWQCVKCSQKHRQIKIPDGGWRKSCPLCGKEIFYLEKDSLQVGLKNNSACKTCSMKTNSGCFKKGHSTRVGKKHSDETKKKISLLKKLNWIKGLYKPHWKSKDQIEIFNLIKSLGYNVEDEYLIDGRPFDIFIRDKNLIIEFNGTYWHCDPRIYPKDFYFSPQKIKAGQVWDNDSRKVKLAESKGYKVKTIWQKDWERCKSKRKFLLDTIEK
jgi:hypothetical protein